MDDIIQAKVEQAIGLLREFDMPVWIAQFARETYEHPEPVQHLVVGTTVSWPSAFIIGADGTTAAIVGTGDVSNVRDVGAYQDVVGYVKDVGPPLLELLARLDPESIGVSFSRSDDTADNLTHGMYLMLGECLRGTPYETSVRPADDVLGALRGRKLPLELDRIRLAIDATMVLFALIEHMLRPGVTERQVYEAVHDSMRQAGLEPAWDGRYDPVVNFGPESKFGHAGPAEIALEPGMLVHVDLGVKLDGYCSDLQRMWYVLRDGEDAPPEDVQRAFDTLLESMQAGVEALRPGVPGWQVDAAARAVLTEAGYEEPAFALGHQLGQACHDGGGLLGPRWPRYGNRPDLPVEVGNVFTIEYGVPSPAGMIAMEEDVVVTADGAEYLSDPQTRLTCLRI